MHQFSALLEEETGESDGSSLSEPEQFARAKKTRLANMEHKVFRREKRRLIS
jgi:hypothetical protein